ncbi:MAG: amidase [Pseudomonadota bacterium]|nr:amidase [Pseudomonadota bacterium]
MKNNLKIYSAFYLGSLLEKRKIDPVILLEHFLSNYKKANTNTKLSFSKILEKEAYKEAILSWKRQKSNQRLSFFDGIPIVWKDLIDIKGFPGFAGSKLIEKLRKNEKVKNATVVKIAKKNGLVSLAKTSMVEFAFGGLGLNKSNKLPNNMMFNQLECAPGGSSTGAATAVFAGLAPLSIGTDTAGSIRIPAAWHSLVGFKPSKGIMSMNGVLPLSNSFDSLGTICKTVKDTKILFNILTNKENNQQLDFLKKIKVGFIYDFNYSQLDNYCKKKIELLIRKMFRLNIEVHNIKLPELKEINDLFSVSGSLVNYEAWKYWKRIIEKNLNLIDSNVVDRFLIGRNMKGKTVENIRNKVKLLKKNIIKKFEVYDFFILPTLSFSPPSKRELKNKKDYHFFNNEVLNNTRGVNVFDLCAISLPMNLIKRKWLSVSIIAKKNNEGKLLAVAEKIESILL